MATQWLWLRRIFWSRNTAIILISGATVGLTAYAVYRFTRRDAEETGDVSENGKESSQQGDGSEKRILVLGLDGAGKTSLLSYLSKQEIVSQPQPTDGFNVMCIHNGNTALNIWEVGGSTNIRSYWSNFIQDTDVLVFVVDSADVGRIGEAGEALLKLLEDEKLKKVPTIVLANKQDLPQAQSLSEIREKLGMNKTSAQQYQIQVLGTRITPGGVVQGIDQVKETLLSMANAN